MAFTAYAGDDRFGVATHFQQGWSTNLMPSIKALGVGYIRDNDNGTVVNGKYVPPGWLPIARANGLKVVLIVGADDNVSAIVTRAVAIAHYGQVAAVEIINEANNVSIFQGQLGEQKLVSLTNMVEAEVRKVSSMAVIGLGEQGSEILYMLSFNPVISGLVLYILLSLLLLSPLLFMSPLIMIM